MYTRPAAAWLAPPHETALARLGAPPPRRPPPFAAARRLSALGQAMAVDVPWATVDEPWATVDQKTYFAEPSPWETFGEAAGTIIRAATPLALPLLQQEIFGEVPRPALPAGYAYSPTGQLVAPPRQAGGWTTVPLLLLGGAVVVVGALYMTGGRRRA